MPDQIPMSKKDERVVLPISVRKPLLRGWLHALATLAAMVFTVLLCLRSRTDVPRLLSLLIYGLSMIELYGVSATYHIGIWSERTCFLLRTLDHANIFLFIAGTYTPLCFNLLSDWLRLTLLILIWSIAVLGMSLTVLTLRTPRWLRTGSMLLWDGSCSWLCLLSWPLCPEQPLFGSLSGVYSIPLGH